jgi:negative regulator of replication initiation
MQPRRLHGLSPESAPLTPDPRTATHTTQDTTVETLQSDVNRLKKILSGERRKHASVESALARYQQVLENQIREQREAFALLGKALKPEPSVWAR